MAWVKIDDQFYDHPKWAAAPGDSIALWLAAMAWCNRNDSTDGFIPTLKLAGLVNVRNVKGSTKDLAARGALHAEKHHGIAGYLIHDYAEFQQPERVRQIAERRAAAGRKGAQSRWGMANGMANAIDVATPVASDVAIDSEWPVSRIPITLTSSVSPTATAATVPTDDDFDRIIELLVDAKAEAHPPRSNPKRWRQVTRANTIAEEGDRVKYLINVTKGTPEGIAGVMLDDIAAAPPQRHPDDCAVCDQGLVMELDAAGVERYRPCSERIVAS